MTYYILYQIKNNINGKIYIGVHKTSNIDDGYMGSGRLIRDAILKYGLDNFSKTILSYHSSYDELLEAEAKIVNTDFIRRDDTYNLAIGGESCWNYVNENGLSGHKFTSEEAKDCAIKAALVRAPLYLDPEWENKRREKIKSSTIGRPSGFKGKVHSDETKMKMSSSRKGQSVGVKNSQAGTIWITNGLDNKKIKKDSQMPDGWYKGRKIKIT